MSFVAECEQCGILERGDFEDVGDAAEDHEQFHDVKINRVVTDGGQDDDGPFFVVDELEATVLSGPFDTKAEAKTDAEDRDGRLLVATQGVLDMIELASTSSLTWGDDAHKPVTDGSGDAVTWRLECMDCDFTDDVEVHGADETPPRKVERQVTTHKNRHDESHVVRVHRLPDQRDVDPSLLTDGGVTDGGLPDTLEGFIEAAETMACDRCGDDVHERYVENGVCVGCRYGGRDD